ncbi:MAG: STAS domain-containing protein [Carbonactinosporaceae bacterium]
MEDPVEPAALTLHVAERSGGRAVLAIAGEIDLANADQLRNRVAELVSHGHPFVVLDFSEVTFCDSVGLSALVASLKQAYEGEGWLRLAALQPAVLKVFRLTALTKVFPIYDSVDEAVEAHP